MIDFVAGCFIGGSLMWLISYASVTSLEARNAILEERVDQRDKEALRRWGPKP